MNMHTFLKEVRDTPSIYGRECPVRNERRFHFLDIQMNNNVLVFCPVITLVIRKVLAR